LARSLHLQYRHSGLYYSPTLNNTPNQRPCCAAKMVKSQGVEAYLVRYKDNHRYPEHEPPPVMEGALDLSTTAYFEVVTGERYAVVIVLTADFDFRNFPDVQFIWVLDGQPRSAIYSSEQVQASIKSKGQHQHSFFTRPALIDGKWMRCGLLFSDLQIGITLCSQRASYPVADQIQTTRPSRRLIS
jgi:hypothetical protein